MAQPTAQHTAPPRVPLPVDALLTILDHLDLSTLLRLATEPLTPTSTRAGRWRRAFQPLRQWMHRTATAAVSPSHSSAASSSTSLTTTTTTVMAWTPLSARGLQHWARRALLRHLIHRPPVLVMRFAQEETRAYRIAFCLRAVHSQTGQLAWTPMLATGLRYTESRLMRLPYCQSDGLVEWQDNWAALAVRSPLTIGSHHHHQHPPPPQYSNEEEEEDQVEGSGLMGRVGQGSQWRRTRPQPRYRGSAAELGQISGGGSRQSASNVIAPPPAVAPDMSTPQTRRARQRRRRQQRQRQRQRHHRPTSDPAESVDWLPFQWKAGCSVRREGSAIVALPTAGARPALTAGWQRRRAKSQRQCDAISHACGTTLATLLCNLDEASPDRSASINSNNNEQLHTGSDRLTAGRDCTKRSLTETAPARGWASPATARCHLRYTVQKERPNIGPPPVYNRPRRSGERWLMPDCIICDVAALEPPPPISAPTEPHSAVSQNTSTATDADNSKQRRSYRHVTFIKCTRASSHIMASSNASSTAAGHASSAGEH